jgi:hypothetical protein
METLTTKPVYRVFFSERREKKRAATAVDNSHKKETHNTTTITDILNKLLLCFVAEKRTDGSGSLLIVALAKYLIMYEYSST